MQDLNDKVTGNSLTATEWNQVPSELQNVIEALGQTLSSGDLNQLGKALAGYAVSGQHYDDSGAADAYVLGATGGKQALPEYRDGDTVTFIPDNTNTGASTVNVAGLGVTNIKLKGGTTDPSAGEIKAGRICRLVYRTSPSAHFELDRSGQVKTTLITASGTFNPASDAVGLKFTAIGAGGGGGGVDGQGAGTAACSEAGAGGGFEIAQVTKINSSYTVTIGAGGTGGAAGNNDGTTGGTTSVVDDDTGTDINISASGGVLGAGRLGSSSTGFRSGSPGGVGSGGLLHGGGLPSSAAIITGGVPVSVSVSGGCPLIGGGIPPTNDNDGTAGTAYGEGGGSVYSRDVATNRAGGNGAGGVVIVEEYF